MKKIPYHNHERFIPVFLYNGTVTKAILLDKEDEFKVKGYGKAVRCKKDSDNKKIARRISFGRALKDIKAWTTGTPEMSVDRLGLNADELMKFKTVKKVIEKYYK